MTRRAAPCVLLLLALAVAAAACAEDKGDLFVVVQETNTPDDPQNPPCRGWANDQVVAVTRACDAVQLRVHLCSDAPLCPATLADVEARLASCEEARRMFTLADAATCP